MNSDHLSTSNYNDAMSANGNSFKDLEISYEKKIHGDKVTLLVGQYVLITDQGAKHYFLAKVDEALPRITDWASEGGRVWPRNYKITPLTPIIERDAVQKAIEKKLREKHPAVDAYTFSNRASKTCEKERIAYVLELVSVTSSDPCKQSSNPSNTSD
jgi:hypothetical protein